jgi:hypothetical protein
MCCFAVGPDFGLPAAIKTELLTVERGYMKFAVIDGIGDEKSPYMYPHSTI